MNNVLRESGERSYKTEQRQPKKSAHVFKDRQADLFTTARGKIFGIFLLLIPRTEGGVSIALSAIPCAGLMKRDD
jgi:hypothetical protein